MRENNFIAFWLVFGFFIGLMIGFFSQNDPFDILSVVVFSTLFFYMMAHVSIALFVRFMESGKVPFEKEAFDQKLDYFYNQLLHREAEVDANYAYISKNDGTADAQKGS
ncbi:hypothetical protein [Hydrogenimonas cancrithermarum]|uniref:Motility integral membrane protein n=1 Tax=Hydrogenimonas cancrithermarum TaxID=2993563 RepID=A0ABN6WTW7_9BACT|nr:hypothetical protein [Hydrogenimonas cancrithermarum]BDY12531.1 hypothetical protein HCR_08430 [Hydrogenimonas cancrithermarum]